MPGVFASLFMVPDRMKKLLLVTAVLEAGAGFALLGFPSAAMRLLFGVPLDTAATVVLGRMTGAALLALGVACWPAGGDPKSRAAKGVVAGMLVYNLAVVVLFTYAGAGLGLHGLLLWPAVILHAAMTVWCGIHLGNKWIDAGKKAQS